MANQSRPTSTSSPTSTATPYIRQIQAADLKRLKTFLSELSPGSLYFRFGKPRVPLWSDKQWADICHPDPTHTTGFVATEGLAPGRYAIVGVARLVADASQQNAEFSVVLADRKQHQGIGTRMMRALVAEAQRRALTTIYGDVLPSNHAMIRFCEGLGMLLGACPGDERLYRMTLRIESQPQTNERTIIAQAQNRYTEVRLP